MNVQAQMSGQFSGQVNQTGNQMRGQHMQNGILLNPQMQNGRSNMSMVDAEVVQKRKIMRRMIYEMLMRKRQQVNEGSQKRCQDITGLLEEGLFKSATSMEEYMNTDTLGIRLHAFLKRMQPTNQAPQHSQFISTPTAVCTMIPTPGLEHHANSSVMGSATVDPTMMTADTCGRTTPSTGSLMPAVNESFSGIRGGSFHTAEGSLSNGHQQVASSFSAKLGGSNMMVAQRPMNQMIPTPGFNGSNNQILSKMDTSNNNGMLSRVDSSVVSQQVPQRQANGQHSRMVQNIGSGIKSSVQQCFQNGSSNGGSGNNLNGASRPLLHPDNQLHQSTVQGDSSGPVNFCNQSVNQLRTSATSRPNSLMNSQLNTQPASYMRPHMAEQVTKSGHLQTPQSIMTDGRTNGYSGKHAGAQSGALVHNDCHSGNGRFSLAAQLPDKQHVQVDFQQGIVGHEEAQCLNLSAGVSSNGQIVASDRARQYRNQVKWLLFLYHARWCRAPAGKCPDSHCIIAQKLLEHLDSCKASPCSYPRCSHSKSLLDHLRSCRKSDCAVCVPYKKFILARKKLNTRRDSDGLQHSINGPLKSSEAGKIEAVETIRSTESAVEAPENQPSVKRMKSEPSSQSLASMNICNVISASHAGNDNYMQIDPEHPGVKAEISSSSNHNGPEINNTTFNIVSSRHLDSGSALDEMSSLPSKNAVEPEKDNDQSKADEVVEPSEKGPGTKSGKPTIKGVSLMEMFTPEQVQEHITGLKQWIGQSRAKVEKNQALEQRMTENSCQLCAVETLSFEPPPIYCTPCGARIKRNAMYYTMGAGDTRHCFCIPCYNESRGDTIAVDGTAVSKSRMQKKKNDEEIDEPWVQCDKCLAWQHQICALFNGRRNESGEAEYTCPNCYLKEIEQGVRLPLPQSAVLLAKDLPGTALSDHIELRLAGRLKQERQERAKSQGRSYDEVPGVEDVVVRVVSSVDKKLEVKPLFLEIFREQNYPSEFPYKSKVVLLFQKIEGVEVCLFGMYVQEFGSECLPPNQRRVYVSYLDSVKYFRPDVKTVTGEALRTFVYHEILIGYLEYCKKRGFASCYIWACPPLKGEDYILYCHPEIQKTPRSDKLREWYLAMLRKASRENIVVGLTNLYDHFFIQSGECKAKVTAARLPYFDGDYWPGAAEDLISQINQEEEARKQNKKGATKKLITKRALKASGQLDLSSNVSKDVVLMHKLGESIAPMKEDFIMVHLQHACTHCCVLMVSGHRWVCELCKNFQLCDRCYLEEEKRDDRERHPIYQKVKHGLMKMEITDVPEDTKDKDEIVESEFFDTRQAFLSLCQGNHYQYDTLRRAKHSSMMVLYHLHNPTAPAFVTTCHICRLDIETGQGWRCETCPDFDVCNACYQKEGGVDHPHKLTNHPSVADRNAQNKEARQMRVEQLRKMLDVLVHASHCTNGQCQYQNCRKVKTLFRHAINCKTRASGGCHLCIRMWNLLRLHARTCKESACRVPRCRDLRDHLKRMQQQSDSRRRAAVKEMMRQRTREVAGKA